MLNVDEIDEAINSLECEDLTYSVCSKLADMYIIKQYLDNNTSDNIITEYNDILPSYEDYKRVKTNYMQHNISENVVIDKMALLCNEISEFIHTLYINTISKEERIIIMNMLENLHNDSEIV